VYDTTYQQTTVPAPAISITELQRKINMQGYIHNKNPHNI
jgi:hypothetical protein